jgi:DnaJ-domain-containing protein 1
MDPNPNPGRSTLRPAISRLVAAMMVADRRVAMEEIDAGNRLDRIGLGPLSPLVGEELQRATRMPIDLDEPCAALHAAGPALIGTVLAALAGVAASDGVIDDDERRVFGAIASRLGAETSRIADHVGDDARGDGVAPAPPAEPGARTPAAADDGANALRALGLGAAANPAEVDAAYLRLVAQYDPAKVAQLGADFVVLAVRKLAALTELYEVARDAAGR